MYSYKHAFFLDLRGPVVQVGKISVTIGLHVHSMASTTSLVATELFLLAVHSYVPSSSYWMLSISTTRLKSLYLVRSGILPPTFLQENPHVWA